MCEPISFCQDADGNLYHCHPELWPTAPFENVMVYAESAGDKEADSHSTVCQVHNLSGDGAAYEAILADAGRFKIDSFSEELPAEHKEVAKRWAKSLQLGKHDTLLTIAQSSDELRDAAVHALILMGTIVKGLNVGGWLDLIGTQITALPEGLSVGGWLGLSGTQIASLPDNLNVGGWLGLRGTQITDVPDKFKDKVVR